MVVSLGTACVTFMTELISSLPHPPATADAACGPDRFWSRIAQHLAQAIGRGVYAPGERLPSEHALAAQFGVNRHTIRRSLASLGQRGLVRATQGRGTFVETFAVDLALGKRTRHRQSLTQAGMSGALQVLSSQTLCATPDQALALDLKPGDALLYVQVLGEGAGQALHVSQRYFPLPRFARLAEVAQATGSITAAFAAHGVSDYLRRHSRISARLPDRQVAALLRQPVTLPALLVTSVNVDTQGVPIEFARAWFAGSRVTLMVNHDEA